VCECVCVCVWVCVAFRAGVAGGGSMCLVVGFGLCVLLLKHARIFSLCQYSID